MLSKREVESYIPIVEKKEYDTRSILTINDVAKEYQHHLNDNQFIEKIDKNRNFVYTPFQQQLLPGLDNTQEKKLQTKPLANYDGYDLFALKTKIMPYAHNLGYDIGFTPNFMKGGYWQHVLYLTDGGNIVILDEKTRQDLDSLVVKHASTEECLVYDSKLGFRFDIPQSWLEAMIPYFFTIINPTYPARIEEDRIYAVFDRTDDYEQQYQQLHILLNDLVTDLYDKDGVILSIEDDQEYIESNNLYYYEGIDDKMAVYINRI